MRGNIERAWLNNSGRLEDLVFSGAKGLCIVSKNRKTTFKLFASMGKSRKGLVIVDTKLHELAFEISVKRGLLPSFRDCSIEKKGFREGISVLDYSLICGEKLGVAELKSAAVDRGNIALYPDAPSERGKRHVQTLIDLARKGIKAFLVFIAPFEWGTAFEPFWEVDEALGNLLLVASKENVELSAFSIGFSRDGDRGEVFLSSPSLPVLLKRQEKQI